MRAHGGSWESGIEGDTPNPHVHMMAGSRIPTIVLDERTALTRRRAAIAEFPQRQPEPPAAPLFEDGEGDAGAERVQRDTWGVSS